MASVVESSARANIRIEIKNDFTEEMDVDTTEDNKTLSDGEVEDGELSDFKESEDSQMVYAKNKIAFPRNIVTNRTENSWTNNDGGFTTGVDIFGKDAKEKLQSRAQRFGLDPNECISMTDEELQELHDSLGITVEDEVNTRFEAIHMHGTEEMSTQDVFGYFGKYGPASIEWINDECCNVVWLDKISAARAFHGLSRPISGMPVTGKCNPFKDETENEKDEDKESTGRSILLISKDREIELYDTQETMTEDDDKENDSCKTNDVIHVSQINIPVPPGYWRLGISHPKAKHILLRFAKRTDKKAVRAEKFSEYYKKYGNPNYGGLRGLISESKKRRMKGVENEEEEPEKVDKENPWGSLAKNWNKDIHEKEIPVEVVVKVPFPSAKPSKSILDRLGTANKTANKPVNKTVNKRVHVESEEEEGEDEEEPEPEKRSKVPRMRMYADEEEARIEKVKQLKKIRALEKVAETLIQNETSVPDLRNRIRKQNIISHPVDRPILVMDRKPRAVMDRPIMDRPVMDRPVMDRPVMDRPVMDRPVMDRSEPITRLSNRIQSVPKYKYRPERIERKIQSNNSDEEVNVQQKSKVMVIVKKQRKPTMASTIWSRLDREKEERKQMEKGKSRKESDSESESSSKSSKSSDSDSDDNYDSTVRSNISKALSHRPGFSRGDLKSRLGLSSEHKSPLRIEINNDHYKKS